MLPPPASDAAASSESLCTVRASLSPRTMATSASRKCHHPGYGSASPRSRARWIDPWARSTSSGARSGPKRRCSLEPRLGRSATDRRARSTLLTVLDCYLRGKCSRDPIPSAVALESFDRTMVAFSCSELIPMELAVGTGGHDGRSSWTRSTHDGQVRQGQADAPRRRGEGQGGEGTRGSGWQGQVPRPRARPAGRFLPERGGAPRENPGSAQKDTQRRDIPGRQTKRGCGSGAGPAGPPPRPPFLF